MDSSGVKIKQIELCERKTILMRGVSVLLIKEPEFIWIFKFE